MLATMGYITPEITGKFPGYLSPSAGLKFADVPNGLAAISKVPAMRTDLGAHGLLRGVPVPVRGHSCSCWGLRLQGLDFLRPSGEDQEAVGRACNGRLAMMAIIGMFFQEQFWTPKVLYNGQDLSLALPARIRISSSVIRVDVVRSSRRDR